MTDQTLHSSFLPSIPNGRKARNYRRAIVLGCTQEDLDVGFGDVYPYVLPSEGQVTDWDNGNTSGRARLFAVKLQASRAKHVDPSFVTVSL